MSLRVGMAFHNREGKFGAGLPCAVVLYVDIARFVPATSKRAFVRDYSRGDASSIDQIVGDDKKVSCTLLIFGDNSSHNFFTWAFCSG